MTSQSFYRKWRSQTFADVVGQAHVTRTLRNALQTGRIAHAYLLCGPRGVGKTSVARILAKAINCQKRAGDGEPCNECSMCRAITEGRALDVIEIDAASNRRIEEMRDLRDKVNFAPSEAPYKVYILDEAHMLTSEASNALLKTLEEPPPRTVFVLVTTEAHRLPDTIISRCQRFNFRRISSQEIVGQLGLVCSREGLTIAPEALALVARAATGSLRDAEGLLDQLVAYCGPTVSDAEARDVLGLTGGEAIRALADSMLDYDLAEGLRLISDVADAGADLGRFVDDFVAHLRGILLLKGGANASALHDVGGDALAAMRAGAERVSLEQLVRLIRIFGEAGLGARGGTAPQLALELALSESILLLSGPQKPVATQDVERKPAPRPSGARHIGEPVATAGLRPVHPVSAVPAPDASVAAATDESGNGATGPVDPHREPAREVPVLEGAAAILESLRRRWKRELVGLAFATNKPLQALLRSCDPCDVKDGCVVIGCDAPFHRDKLGETQNRQVIENAIATLLGVSTLVRFEVIPRQKRGQLPSATSDPLVKEVLSWGGRIRQVVPDLRSNSDAGPAPEQHQGNEEVNFEP